MVRKGGLEPPQGEPHKILSLARLPIPPLSHTDGMRMVEPGRPGVKAIRLANSRRRLFGWALSLLLLRGEICRRIHGGGSRCG